MQTSTPDFQQATFSPETENLYCPTSVTGRVDACSQDDTTLNETLTTFKDAYRYKYAECLRLADVVAAETTLVKKSLLVTGLAAGAVAVFACFCWLIINVAIALTLNEAGAHYLVSCGVLLTLNSALALYTFAIAKDAFRHITLMPVFHALRSQIPDGSDK